MKDREKQVVKTGIISILANLVLVGFKTTIGLFIIKLNSNYF